MCQCLLNFALMLNLIGLKGGKGRSGQGLNLTLRCLVRLSDNHHGVVSPISRAVGGARGKKKEKKKKAAVGDLVASPWQPEAHPH